MKKIYVFLLIVFCSNSLYSQSIDRFVISSFGGSYYDGASFVMDFTMGEVAVSTLSNANNFLTQGFQQPFSNSVVFIEENSKTINTIIVFPNPVVDQLTIQLNGNNTGEYSIYLYDILGQLVICENTFSDPNGFVQFQIDFSKFSTGSYYLRIIKANIHIQAVKIIKINQ